MSCDDPSLKIMIFIIFIGDFTKMPFKAHALTGVNYSVMSCKTHFIGISSLYSSLRTRGRKRFVIWSYNEGVIDV